MVDRRECPSADTDASDDTIRGFIACGGIVLACHLAFKWIVYPYVEQVKL